MQKREGRQIVLPKRRGLRLQPAVIVFHSWCLGSSSGTGSGAWTSRSNFLYYCCFFAFKEQGASPQEPGRLDEEIFQARRALRRHWVKPRKCCKDIYILPRLKISQDVLRELEDMAGEKDVCEPLQSKQPVHGESCGRRIEG